MRSDEPALACGVFRCWRSPHVAEHEHSGGGGERDGEDASEHATEEGGSDHEGDNDGEGVQADAVTHDFWLDDEAFEDLDHGEDGYRQKRVEDIAKVDRGDKNGGTAGDDGADVGDDGEDAGHDPDQHGHGEADGEESNSIEDAVTEGDQDLSTEEGNQVVVNGAEDEGEFLFEFGVSYWEVMGPL